MSDRRHLALAPLCAAAAAGRRDDVAALARASLAAGCTREEIRESLLTLAPFCGFPRTLDAFDAARASIAGAAAPRDERPVPSADGAAFFDRVYGSDAAAVRGKLRALDVEVAAWIEQDAYGKILSRPGITASLRERIAVVLLVAQGLRNQLSGHVRGALRCGATAAEVASFLDSAAMHLPADELAFARSVVARVAAPRADE